MHQIINASYCVRYTGFDFLVDVAKKTGTGVELAVNYQDPEFMNLQNTHRLRFMDIPVTLHGPFKNVEMASAKGTLEHDRFMDAIKEALDVYEAFHARSMVLHTHGRHDIPACDKEAMRGYAIDTMQEVAALAQGRAKLTVENVGTWVRDAVLFNEEQFIDLFTKLPEEIGCLIDIGHALINRWDVSHVVHALNKRITSYHIHNNNGSADSHRPTFEAGNRYTAEEMEELLLLTNKYSPDSEWIIEYAPGEHISKEMVIADLERLKALNK